MSDTGTGRQTRRSAVRARAARTAPAAHGIDGPGFDVVIPSLPGYGFTGRPTRTGVTCRYTAGLWHRLMRGLDISGTAATSVRRHHVHGAG